MKRFFLLLAISFSAFAGRAQTQFYGTVKIEFEKTINVHQWYKELEPEWFEQIKDHVPQSVTTYHDFIGDSTHSVFKPGREVALDPRTWYRPVADKNVVFTDFQKGITISQKPVYEETFLVQDSLLKIKWKLTPDTRVIAGFECRKAVGILYDSIAVFAFYTDELMVSGGPEAINGLPGMILGMGIPRLHCTWFATRVEVNNVPVHAITPSTKGKKVDRQTMVTAIDKVLKQWGTYGSKMIINFLI